MKAVTRQDYPDNDGRWRGWVERKLADLATRVSTRAVQEISDGDFSILNAGALKMYNRFGDLRFWLGKLAVLDPDGEPQMGLGIWRDGDGSVAVALYDADAGDGYQQAFNIFDRSSNAVLADDTNSGQGLARPYVPWSVTTVNDAVATTSGTFAEVAVAAASRQHPKVRIALSASAGASTTGEVRVVHNATGTVIAGPTAIPSGGSIAPLYDVTLPAGTHMDWTYLSIQARRTGGAGSISVRPYGVEGRQT